MRRDGPTTISGDKETENQRRRSDAEMRKIKGKIGVSQPQKSMVIEGENWDYPAQS